MKGLTVSMTNVACMDEYLRFIEKSLHFMYLLYVTLYFSIFIRNNSILLYFRFDFFYFFFLVTFVLFFCSMFFVCLLRCYFLAEFFIFLGLQSSNFISWFFRLYQAIFKVFLPLLFFLFHIIDVVF